jgi:hypothetical protein
MPVRSHYFEQRKIDQEKFNEVFSDYVTHYDITFDFDGKINFARCHKETAELKAFLDEYSVPYTLVFSGAGFHIKIMQHTFLIKKPSKKALKLCIAKIEDFVFCVAEMFDFETLDLNIYDPRRIWKVPYSIDFRSGNVAMPLTDEQFGLLTEKTDVFKVENVNPETFYKRGLLERQGTKENFKKMLAYFKQ